MRPSPPVPLLVLAVALGLALGCQTPTASTGGDAPLETTTFAYQAYERGDCSEIERSARSVSLDDWPASEARSSFLLVEGFCAERAGDVDRARETYRQLLREAPLSFASDDARERLRVLRLRENDPGYEDWLADARSRALQGNTDAPVVVDSVPPLLFDGVALRAVREWRYATDADGTKSERQAIRLVFKPEEAETPDLDAPVESSPN